MGKGRNELEGQTHGIENARKARENSTIDSSKHSHVKPPANFFRVLSTKAASPFGSILVQVAGNYNSKIKSQKGKGEREEKRGDFSSQCIGESELGVCKIVP